MGSHESDYLRLTVENFGPIAAADVEMRPLTVFVGPSSSGKSYLAKLVYALHQSFGSHPSFRRSRWKRVDYFDRTKTPVDLDAVAEWLEEYLAVDLMDDELTPPEDVVVLAREALTLPDVGKLVAAQLRLVFGAEALDDFILTSRSVGEFTFEHSPTDTTRKPVPFRYEFTMRSDQLTADISITEDAPIRLDRSKHAWRVSPGRRLFHHWPDAPPDPGRINRRQLKTVLADLAEAYAVGPLSRPAHYLPAGRSGGLEVQQVAVGSALDRLTADGQHASSTTLLSGVLRDYLAATSIDLRVKPSNWSGGKVLAGHIEESMLGGSVRVEEAENGVPSVLFRPAAWKRDLPLARASSMINEMIPVVLYLRHHVSLGSTLIIEEPEAHMHPAMQVRLATELARIVAAGIRVIVTVHSDWILSALANICRMTALTDDQRDDLATGEVALPASQVGVWEFQPDGTNGTRTREIDLDSDTGMYDAGYPRVAEALYNDWAEIHSRLQDD